MFCSKCGKELDSSAMFCPNCGQPVAEVVTDTTKAENVANEQTATVSDKPKKKFNVLALVGFILSFFSFPYTVGGLVCSILGYKTATNYADDKKGMAKAGIIISAISIGLYIVATIVSTILSVVYGTSLIQYIIESIDPSIWQEIEQFIEQGGGEVAAMLLV